MSIHSDNPRKNLRKNQEVYSQKVYAGRRTYFFDVKPTVAKDYYLTITEIKKQSREDGKWHRKSRIFLYKEDLNKFVAALQETAEHIKTELLPDYDFDQFSTRGDEPILPTDQD